VSRPVLHVRFVAGARERLQVDTRIVGIAASGSWVRDEMDEYSDLDLVVAVEPDAIGAVLEDRVRLAAKLGPLLAAFPADHIGKPEILICLYGPPLLHVDLDFTVLPDAASRIDKAAILWERDGALTAALERPRPAMVPGSGWQWLEDRFWVWVHYLTTKLARRELFEVISGLAFVRDRVLGPVLLAQHGRPAYGVRRVELLPPEVVAQLRETLADHEAVSCVRAIRAAVNLYQGLRELRAPSSLARRLDAERAALAYLAEIETRIRPA
jgi:predicted nucleotidyltransferase